jgi:hypothetical protein
MTDLNKMWAALEKYQPYADKDGHGETWRRMCSERTEEAAAAAVEAESAAYWSDIAIKRIERAIKEREPAPSNIEPTSSDAGQPQAVDAQHSEIEQLKAERNRAYRACEQISVRLHAAEAERDALKAQRQPLTGKAIIAAYDNMELSGKLSAFIEGARYAEQAHGIGGDK